DHATLCLHTFPTRRSSDLINLIVEATRKAVIADVLDLLKRESFIQNVPLHVGDPAVADWTVAGVLSNIEYNQDQGAERDAADRTDRKSTRLNSSHQIISYA